MDADARFNTLATALGVDVSGELIVGGSYQPLLADGAQLYVSGQIPRVGDSVAVTGAVGAEVTLQQAQLAAKIALLRALALLQRHLGSLQRVLRVPRLTVFVQAHHGFTQLGEVADGASVALQEVLGHAGRHSRTTVGVYQLPHNASVQLDLMATAEMAGADTLDYTPTTASLQFARSV